MKRILLIAVAFAAGCQTSRPNVASPQAAGRRGLSIEEQKSQAREKYSLIEDSALAPKTGVDRPGVMGR